jgi:hypothetical protein
MASLHGLGMRIERPWSCHENFEKVSGATVRSTEQMRGNPGTHGTFTGFCELELGRMAHSSWF